MSLSLESNSNVCSISKNFNVGCVLLVLELSKRYGFDSEDALRYLRVDGGSEEVVREVGKGRVSGDKKKKRKKIIPLPWTGVVCVENCGALEYNNGLFTQCGSGKELGDYCGDCIKKKEENNNEFEYGTVEDRQKKEFRGMGGKGVIPYGNVLKKKKISREEAEAAAREKGVEIPEHLFAEEVRKRGRPKKISTAVEDTPEKKKRGRPGKRSATVVCEENSVDLIKNLANMTSEKSAEKPAAKSPEKSPAKSPAKSPEKSPEKSAAKSPGKTVEVEQEDNEITVHEFTHKGISYLRSDDNVLYDPTTQEVVGVWEENTQTIMEAQEESDEDE